MANNPALKAFINWLWAYHDERRFKYYEGHLCQDRYTVWAIEDPEVNEPIDTLATEVFNAYLAGQVLLTQKRLGDGTYAYWATKTKEML